MMVSEIRNGWSVDTGINGLSGSEYATPAFRNRWLFRARICKRL